MSNFSTIMTNKELKNILQFFSALSDKTRLNIILSLLKQPRTVSDLHNAIGKDKISLSAISHQLKYLNDLNIIEYEKKGRKKYFRLSSMFCWCILKDAIKHFDNNIKCKNCKKVKSDIHELL